MSIMAAGTLEGRAPRERDCGLRVVGRAAGEDEGERARVLQ